MSQNILTLNNRNKTVRYLTADIFVICFIYLVPSLSHMTSIPFYLFDPMRLALVFCIIHTDSKNSILIALTLPLISLLISSHPILIKSIMISAELLINVLAFYLFYKRQKNLFVSMFISILLAKVFYYSAKIIILNFGLIKGNLVSTPLWLQLIVMLLLSIYALKAFKGENKPQVH